VFVGNVRDLVDGDGLDWGTPPQLLTHVFLPGQFLLTLVVKVDDLLLSQLSDSILLDLEDDSYQFEIGFGMYRLEPLPDVKDGAGQTHGVLFKLVNEFPPSAVLSDVLFNQPDTDPQTAHHEVLVPKIKGKSPVLGDMSI
jgi:hypothetical protein